MSENDPLWRLRHALAGIGLALACSVLIGSSAPENKPPAGIPARVKPS